MFTSKGYSCRTFIQGVTVTISHCQTVCVHFPQAFVQMTFVLYFVDEEIKAYRGQMTCPKSHCSLETKSLTYIVLGS